MNQLVELCRNLISMDSSSLHGNLEISQYIAELGRSWGLAVELHKENYDGVECANLVMKPANSVASKCFMMLSHLDTDNPGEYAQWGRTGANPFNASLNGDSIFGLGVADAKTDFVCKLLALKEFSKATFSNVTPVVIGTFGLASGAGTIRLVRKKTLKAIGAVVGGPTNMKLALKGPGYAKVEISIPFSEEEMLFNQQHNLGEGAISQSKFFSRPSESTVSMELLDNPIVKLLDYLKNIPGGTAILSVDGGTSATTAPDSAFLELDLASLQKDNMLEKLIAVGEALKKLAAELKTISDSDFSPQYSTLNLGLVRTFPEEIKLVGHCRLIPANGRDTYDRWLQRLREECERLGAGFRVQDYKPPFRADSQSEFSKLVTDIYNKSVPGAQLAANQNCSAANVLSRLGVESIVFGAGAYLPGESELITGEYVKVDNMTQALYFYTELIKEICS